MKRKIKYGICCLVTLLMLTSCSGGKDMKVDIGRIKVEDFNYENQFEQKKEIDECGLIEEVSVMVDVGNIDISYNNDNKVKILAQYNAQTMTKKDMEDIINSLEIKTVNKSSNVVISIGKKGTEENAWEWIELTAEKKYNLSVDLHISLPKIINEYEIIVDTGNVTVKDLEGAFKIQTDTGNIYINGIVINGDSSFCTDTGNIELVIKENGSIKETDVEVYADTGNIKLDFGSLEYREIETREDATEKNIEILEKCRVYASTDTGFISVK